MSQLLLQFSGGTRISVLGGKIKKYIFKPQNIKRTKKILIDINDKINRQL